MKKNFIAKLLVLVMVLSLVPVAALAADTGDGIQGNAVEPSSDAYNNPYTPVDPDPDPTPTPDPDPTPDPEPVVPSTPATPSTPEKTETPTVVETIDNVKTETNNAGQTVVTAVIEVKDATAPVEVSEKAVEELVSQAQEGDVVAIVAETTGAVSAPATQLADLIEKTGNPVSMGNSVAAVAVNQALVDLAGGAAVKVEPIVNIDGTISVPVTAGNKEIAPEKVPGGINVEIAVNYSASKVSAVNAVKADKTEVELKWSISGGQLKVNLTVSGAIKIVKK